MIDFLYSIDNNITQIKFLRNSINTLKNYNKNINIWLLTCENFKYNDIFNDCKTIEITNEFLFKYLPITAPIKRKELTNTMFYRLLIPFINEFDNLDQIIYIDADTEINNDLTELTNYNINEFYGVNESWLINTHNKRLGHIKHLTNYCNSGVLVINLNKLRLIDYKNILLNAVNLYNKYIFDNPDQDMLNISFNIGILPRKFNSYPYLEDITNASILHYVNALKNILKQKTDNIKI